MLEVTRLSRTPRGVVGRPARKKTKNKIEALCPMENVLQIALEALSLSPQIPELMEYGDILLIFPRASLAVGSNCLGLQ